MIQCISGFAILLDYTNGFVGAPRKKEFVLNFLNIADILTSVPIIIQYFVNTQNIVNLSFIRIWRFMRILRFLRIYKVLSVITL
jgi:hypothetical protein